MPPLRDSLRYAVPRGLSLGNNRSCHGQADAHSTPCPLPRDCWTPRCPPVTERLEREAVEEGPMRRPLQACTAHHGSARPYAGAKDGGIQEGLTFVSAPHVYLGPDGFIVPDREFPWTSSATPSPSSSNARAAMS